MKTNNSDFPRVEKVQNENLRDCYNKLWAQFNEICKEKDLVIESLNKETLSNEEQRIYIEILKQTIENSINKLNLGQLLQHQKYFYFNF